MPVSKVVNIGIVLPSDIVFEIGDEEFRVRGNLESEVALTLLQLLEECDVAYAIDGDVKPYLKAAQNLMDYMLPIFQEKQPELDHFPVGLAGATRIAAVLVSRVMGATDEALESISGQDDADPPTTPSRKAPRSTKPRPSTPRNGSRRS